MVLTIHPGLANDLMLRGYGLEFRGAYFDALVKHLGLLEQYSESVSLNDFFSRISASGWGGTVYYVLSSVERGRKIVGYGKDRLTPGASFLDVGCGFGGSLLAAHELGAKPFGIELSADRINASVALLKDNNAPINVDSVDIFDHRFEFYPRMNLIVCENVIEHVDDPRRFMKRMFEKLAPGGALVMEIPNGAALSIATKEPHYDIPFLSLLPHDTAKTLFQMHLGISKFGLAHYEVGQYFCIDWYRSVLGAMASSVSVSYRPDALMKFDDFSGALKRFRELALGVRDLFPNVTPLMLEHISETAFRYHREASRLFSMCRGSGGEQSPLFKLFEEKYLAAAWIVRFDGLEADGIANPA